MLNNWLVISSHRGDPDPGIYSSRILANSLHRVSISAPACIVMYSLRIPEEAVLLLADLDRTSTKLRRD